MKFVKMNGLGNDYIFIEEKEIRHLNRQFLSKKLCDRNFSIGGDGIVVYSIIDDKTCKMEIYNKDGSEAEMCGNAVRCLARLMYDQNKVNFVSINTKSGIKTAIIQSGYITVNMGKPLYIDSEIYPVIIGKKVINGYRVNMGNPHYVVFGKFNGNIAKLLEKNTAYFPQKTNVEFVSEHQNDFSVRVFERGTGETMACGTGASAVFAVTNRPKAKIILRGGTLLCEKNEGGEILQTGWANYNYFGELED